MKSLFRSVKNLLSVDMGIDMGTTRTRVFVRGSGVALDEPSFVAVNYRDGETEAVGKEAYKLFGRCPPHLEILKPVERGVIENFELAEAMLNGLLENLFKKKALLGARICVVSPTGATDVEKKAFEDVAIQVGGREVFLVEAPVAAAVGMGLPIDKARGLVCVYLGGGTTQTAVFSEGELMFSVSEPVGGEDLTEAVISGIRKKHRILVGAHTAEQLKTGMGRAYPSDRDETREIYGKSVMDGLPRAQFISNWELREMMEGPLNRIANAIKASLEKAPPDLAADIKRHGLYLCGGTAQLEGMGSLISHVTGLSCSISGNPQHACIQGAEKVSGDMRKYGRFTTTPGSRQFTG